MLRSQLNYSIVSSPYKRCTDVAKSVCSTYGGHILMTEYAKS
jgi:hypothetical protein